MSKVIRTGRLGSFLWGIKDETERVEQEEYRFVDGDEEEPLTMSEIYDRLRKINGKKVFIEAEYSRLSIEEDKLRAIIVDANAQIGIKSEVVGVKRVEEQSGNRTTNAGESQGSTSNHGGGGKERTEPVREE